MIQCLMLSKQLKKTIKFKTWKETRASEKIKNWRTDWNKKRRNSEDAKRWAIKAEQEQELQ